MATNTNKHQLKGTSSEEDQVIPVMLAVQHGLSESPMLWGEEIDRMLSIELQKRGAPHGHFAIILFVDDTSVGVTQRDDKQLEVADDTDMDGVTQRDDKQLEVADDTDMDGVTLHHDKRIRSNRRMKQLVKTRAETERESNWCHPISRREMCEAVKDELRRYYDNLDGNPEDSEEW